MIRLLCIAAMLATGLISAAPSAQAAVPNQWGFAYVDVFAGVPTLLHQAGSWPAGFNVTASTGAPGQVFVKFPQIASNGGVVHVTASSPNPQFCQVQKWTPAGPDELVSVQCYAYGGAPASVRFSIVYETSTGVLAPPQAFGYVHYNGIGIVSSFNSAAGVNTVAAGPPGIWTVTLPNFGSSGAAGGLQVTAVNPNRPARCKVASWTSTTGGQQVEVRCYDGTSNPLPTGWTLTYQRERSITGGAIPPSNFGYTFDPNPGNPGPYVPLPAPINYNPIMSNTIQDNIPGRLVTFSSIGVLPDHAQVTAYGQGPGYCKLRTVWSTGVDAYVLVDCWVGTTLLKQQYFATYTSSV